MEPKPSPNQLGVAAKSLAEIEKLTRIVSHSTTANVNYIGKGLFSLLLLFLISSGLRMDFRALMTFSSITREGAFDETGNRLPDPDQPKRKTLRGIVTRLDELHMLTTNDVGYSDPQLAQTDVVLEHIPDEGVICWAGGELFVKNKPSGRKTSVFALKKPESKIINWLEVQRVLPTELDPSRIELCTNQLNLSLNLMEGLLEKNKVANPEVTKTLKEFRNQSNMVQVRKLAYLLAATEKTQGLRRRLEVLSPLLS